MILSGESVELPIGSVSEAAERIARQAHQGQYDQAGAEYIGHPARVAGLLAARGWVDEVVAAGWLHDVLEDTDWSAACLAAAGMPDETIRLVRAMTRLAGQKPSDYYGGLVTAGPAAVAVKTADIDDNTDPQRLSLLEPAVREHLVAKYKRARRALRPSPLPGPGIGPATESVAGDLLPGSIQ